MPSAPLPVPCTPFSARILQKSARRGITALTRELELEWILLGKKETLFAIDLFV